MSRIQIIASGLIYRNPKPHLRSRQAYFPSLVRLTDGGLVAAFDIGEAFEATDVRSYVSRSDDDGQTWSSPIKMFEPDTSRSAVSTSCRINHDGNGNLIGLAILMHRHDEEMGLANPETDGFVRTDFATIKSVDGGKSWTPPAIVELPVDWGCFEICSPIIPLPSGRWLLPTSPWPDWDGVSKYGPKALVFISDDQGSAWSKAVDTMNRSSERVAFFDQKVARLSDGRAMALCWVVDLNSKQNLPNHMAFSSDSGDTFSAPIATPLHGETCTPLGLPGNNVLCVYRRADKRGLWAHLCKIDGQRWQELAYEPLWGTNTASHDESAPSLLAQMSTLRFGCPTLTRLTGNNVLGALWCIEDAV